jgi:hypothetical protein
LRHAKTLPSTASQPNASSLPSSCQRHSRSVPGAFRRIFREKDLIFLSFSSIFLEPKKIPPSHHEQRGIPLSQPIFPHHPCGISTPVFLENSTQHSPPKRLPAFFQKTRSTFISTRWPAAGRNDDNSRINLYGHYNVIVTQMNPFRESFAYEPRRSRPQSLEGRSN